MSNFAYRLAYVVICCAAMLALWFVVRWLVYGISDDFAWGLGTGALIGASIMYAVTTIDRRNAQRSPKA